MTKRQGTGESIQYYGACRAATKEQFLRSNKVFSAHSQTAFSTICTCHATMPAKASCLGASSTVQRIFLRFLNALSLNGRVNSPHRANPAVDQDDRLARKAGETPASIIRNCWMDVQHFEKQATLMGSLRLARSPRFSLCAGPQKLIESLQT